MPGLPTVPTPDEGGKTIDGSPTGNTGGRIGSDITGLNGPVCVLNIAPVGVVTVNGLNSDSR